MDTSAQPLDLVSKLGHPLVRARLANQATSPSVGPLVVDLDPTTFCDLDCPECISIPLLRAGRFGADRLMQLVDEMADLGVAGVVLIGGGEPLLHPNTDALLQRLLHKGIRVGVVTNGLHAARHLGALKCVDWVRVSLDASTPETYSRIRPSRSNGSRFSECIRGIEALVGLKGPTVGASFVAIPDGSQPGNLAEISSAARLVRDLGCNYFEVKALLQPDHQLFNYVEADLERMRKQCRLAKSHESDFFQIHLSDNLLTLLDYADQNSRKAYNFCPMTSLRTVVTPTGVYPCPYHRGDPAYSYGDPSTSTLGSIWTQRSSPDPSRDCRFYCARHRSNEVLIDHKVVQWNGEDDIFL